MKVSTTTKRWTFVDVDSTDPARCTKSSHYAKIMLEQVSCQNAHRTHIPKMFSLFGNNNNRALEQKNVCVCVVARAVQGQGCSLSSLFEIFLVFSNMDDHGYRCNIMSICVQCVYILISSCRPSLALSLLLLIKPYTPIFNGS